MHVLTELRLTTYVHVVGTKGKRISNAWLGCDCSLKDFWKVEWCLDYAQTFPHKFEKNYFVLPLCNIYV